MGAHNFLFYLEKLYSSLPKRQPRLAPGHEYLVPAPVPLVIIETLFIVVFWITLSYIVLQEMGYGQRGNPEFSHHYVNHLFFGCICPVAAGFLLNRDLYRGRQFATPFIMLTAAFYAWALWSLEIGRPWRFLLTTTIILTTTGLLNYLYRNDKVCAYFDSLKP